MDSLQLLNSKKDFFIVFSILLFILFTNFSYEYFKYKSLIKEEIFEDSFQIVNIYKKEKFNILKLQNEQISFFTSVPKSNSFKKLENIKLAFITSKIDFLDYLKGFYAKSIYFEKDKQNDSLRKYLYEKIVSQHESIQLQQLFGALFLAIPISKEYKEFYTNISISHLIAISGFHLSILAGFLYALFFYPYMFVQEKFFIYRNRRADLLFISIVILFLYLLLTNIVPSLLRSFIMFVITVYFLRCKIKILSFQTLFFTALLIISFFPKYMFSISLWFSIAGVFYIFLYIKYFKSLPKLFNILFFNFWIFFAFNPIVHYFFPNTSYEQLLSPFLTLLFTIFYPFELFSHIVQNGDFLDKFLVYLLSFKFNIYTYYTDFNYFIVYILFSLFSIFGKKYFIILNILLMIFNIKLYF